MADETTPRPWKIVKDDGDLLIRDKNGDGIIFANTDMADVFGLIVRAVNAHDALVAALEAMLAQGDFSSPHWAGDQARAAIARAKGEPR